jgi:hypothetical protein
VVFYTSIIINDPPRKPMSYLFIFLFYAVFVIKDLRGKQVCIFFSFNENSTVQSY